jgi:hypothetical protein
MTFDMEESMPEPMDRPMQTASGGSDRWGF